MIKNIQNILNGFQRSSFLSGEVLLDILNDLIFLSSYTPISGNNPETHLINHIFGKEIIDFEKPFNELQNLFPDYVLRIFPIKKFSYTYSDALQKIMPEITINEIELHREIWLKILLDENIIKEINENNILPIYASQIEKQKIEKSYKIIEKRYQDFFKKYNQDYSKMLGLYFLAYKKYEIQNLRELLQKPQKQNIYFDETTCILHINKHEISFSKSSLLQKMIIEFFKHPNEQINYWDFLQKYDDRNISEKSANSKGSTLITKINKKIEEKTSIKEFFSRGKGYFYRKDSE